MFGSSSGGQALTKIILDLYINNFHDKLLYMYYGQINHSDSVKNLIIHSQIIIILILVYAMDVVP